MRSIELFTGAGGLAIGTHRAGFHHVALIERDQNACRTLFRNIEDSNLKKIHQWKGKVHVEDVRKIQFGDLGSVDLVAGGPPCQPFSIGGRHRGMLDERDMIPQFVRAVRELRPKAFIMENVKGLTRQSFANYFRYTLCCLEMPTVTRMDGESWEQHLARLEFAKTNHPPETGYTVQAKLLNAAKYGVPQTRERVFIIGFREDLCIECEFPSETHGQDSLLYDQWVTGAYWSRHGNAMPAGGPPKRYRNRVERLRSAGVRPKLKPWVTVRDVLADVPDPREMKNGFNNHRFQPGARTYVGHTGSAFDWPSKTLKAGDHGVPGGENMIAYGDGSVRYFTAREAARIQTFPDEWFFEGAWTITMRQLGNAVPVSLAELVARMVAKKLR